MKALTKKIDASIFLTDGGLETELIFTKNIELPHFAAFPLLDRPKYQSVLREYFIDYLEIANRNGTSYILESPTWRANKDWGYKLGYNTSELLMVNQKAILFLKELKEAYQHKIEHILLSGQIGPRGDGYRVKEAMSIQQAKTYHDLQMTAFQKTEVDMVSAITMNYSNEAIGICLSAQEKKLPVIISFTVETDGKLPSGESLQKAIEEVDRRTNNYPLYYMINCAHPSHFIEVIEGDYTWKSRIKGIRANASCKSHSELDESTELDSGNVIELADWHGKLYEHLPNLRVYGGCCGTDASHVESICKQVLKSA